jgi:hypothetical protein
MSCHGKKEYVKPPADRRDGERPRVVEMVPTFLTQCPGRRWKCWQSAGRLWLREVRSSEVVSPYMKVEEGFRIDTCAPWALRVLESSPWAWSVDLDQGCTFILLPHADADQLAWRFKQVRVAPGVRPHLPVMSHELLQPSVCEDRLTFHRCGHEVLLRVWYHRRLTRHKNRWALRYQHQGQIFLHPKQHQVLFQCPQCGEPLTLASTQTSMIQSR